MEEILALREGRWDDVFPGLLPRDFPRPFVANMIDMAARDTSEVIAPLPSFSCTSTSMVSERARTFADKRTKIANYYVECSNFQAQMYSAADRLLSYGFCAFFVEPDFDDEMPKIRVDNNHKAYYELDPLGRRTKIYCRIFRQELDTLIHQFPEVAPQLAAIRPEWHVGSFEVEVVRWYDEHQQALVVLDHNILLRSVENKITRCPVRVVEMPKLGDVVRGQYDDAIGVQGARALTQVYLLKTMEMVANAPLAVPQDVQDVPMGPEAIIHSENPEKIGRVAQQVPPGLFTQLQNFTDETRLASRHPEGRSGVSPGSIVTGQGVEALMGMFSTQVRTAQEMLERGLQDVIAVCFEMDQHFWPNISKTVTGNDAGTPYEVTYRPVVDIKGSFSCEVSYGLTAGLDPNRALVFLLQLYSAGGISLDTLQRQLPVKLSVVDEMRKITLEHGRQALDQAMSGYAQSIPMMATQGMDPNQAIGQIATYLQLVQKGKAVEEAVAEAFAPPPAPPQAEGAAPAAEDPLAALMGGGGPPGGGGMAPPAQDDLLMSLAGMTPGGNANLQSTVSRRQPSR